MNPSNLICITQTEVIGRINLLKLCWFDRADTLLQAVKVVSLFWTNDTFLQLIELPISDDFVVCMRLYLLFSDQPLQNALKVHLMVFK